MKDGQAGVTINNEGITDNTILLSVSCIPWSDILEIKEINVRHGKLLILVVINPTNYISRQSNFVKRRIMKVLLKAYGSPVIITSNELRGDFDKIQNIIQIELNKNKF